MLANISKFLNKNRVLLFLLAFGLVFFCIYANFNLITMGESPVKLSSPDETGNYFWISKLAQGEPLYYFEELNGVGTNLIHLRSMNTIDGRVTPGSFLGMIFVYGWLAKIFGMGIVPYLTPFFAVLGMIFFYLLIKLIFERKDLALVSTALLSFLPGWFYYAARGMYHNVLFISLLLIGLYLLFIGLGRKDGKSSNLKIQKSKIFFYFVSGIFIGLAIVTRTAEIVWLGILLLLIFIFNFKKIYWPGLVMFVAGMWLPLLALFYYNQILYGAPISAGYKAVIGEGGLSAAISSGLLFQILITPFGFHPRAILGNAMNYLYYILPYWSVPTILGSLLFFVLPKKFTNISYKKRLLYLGVFVLISIYLLIFYGSWVFSDRIDNQVLSLGTSYLRYWLPIYMMTLPFLAYLILGIGRILIPNLKRKNFYAGTISFVLIIILFMPTINFLMRQTDESLFLLKNLEENRIKSAIINKIINRDDVVVIYKQADKILFPERDNIITELVVPADYEAVAQLAKIRPVYYYTFAPDTVIQKLAAEKFAEYGLELKEREKIFGKDAIYKIVIRN